MVSRPVVVGDAARPGRARSAGHPGRTVPGRWPYRLIVLRHGQSEWMA
ncbi:MAG: hypothetical protein M3Z75_09190 [Actinomycetota bacterium]|nr:hypothetical protein [Actinomycetota bacterium]